MNKSDKTRAPKPLFDDYGNLHYLADELARAKSGPLTADTITGLENELRLL